LYFSLKYATAIITATEAKNTAIIADSRREANEKLPDGVVAEAGFVVASEKQ
jgi:adenosylcobinamide amidohydrolase